MTNKKEITVNLVKFRIRQALLGEFLFEVEKGLEMTKNVSVPEGYKKTELGVIPEEWKVEKLGLLSELITKGTTPTTIGYSYQDKGINFIKIESIDANGNFLPNLFSHISEDANKSLKRSILKENDLLFSIAGALGRVAIVNSEILPANTNQALAIIRLKRIQEVDLKYIYFFLKGSQIQNLIDRINVQSAQANLSLKNINNFKIALPQKEEQQKIASILSKVDEQIEHTEQIIEKTELLKKGLMQKLLTKGIGHTKFKKTELGEISEEWSVVTIGDVITLQRGHDLPVTERTEGDFPVVGSNGIVGYHNEYKAKGPGVSMGRSGTIGKIYYCDSDYWPLNTSLYVKDFKNNNPKFIYYLLQNLDYERFNSGTSVPTLNRNLVHPYKIIFPKQYDEQQKIAYILSKVDSQIQDNQNYLSKLQELKKGLMQDLLTGKVRV